MGKLDLKSNKTIWLWFTLIIVFVLHNAQYIIGASFEQDEDTHFTPFAYKAPFSLSEDNLSYAGIIRYSGNHPSIYRYDPLIKENNHLSFADGNIVNSYLGLFNKVVQDINLTYYFGGLIPLIIAVFLIFKIIEIFFNQHAIPISIAVSIVILCSNFDDFFGLTKFLTGFFFPDNYHSNFLVLGYAQRFPYCQSTTVFFLFWIYRFIQYRSNSSFKNQIWLAIALLGLQYSYFYYWSYAIPITAAMIFFDKKSFKEFIPLTLSYLILTAHYWLAFYQFNQLEFLAEYRERIKGIETYSLFGIVVFGTLCLIPFYKNGKRWFNLILITIPFAAVFGIKLFNYFLQPHHPLFIVAKFLLPLTFGVLIFLAGKWNKWKDWALISLINYYLIFILCSLKFIFGYNVQPYHWVYASYYPFLCINLLIVWKAIIQFSWVKKITFFAASLTLIFGVLNSFKSAERNHKFWSINNDEVEVIELLQQNPYSVIGGNNMMPLITFTAHVDVYLYEGSCSHKRSMYEESAQRFIHPYKLMGYSDSLIVNEYKKYEDIWGYHNVVISDNVAARDSLARIYPDNILGSIEVMWCYFMQPNLYVNKFKKSVQDYAIPNYDLDYLVIYKPTFSGNYSEIKGVKTLENKTFIVYQVN